VLPLLAPSSPFVVFSPWQQPLAEAMSQLTASKAALMLQLQESWMRPYQVLPGRTHPHMNMTTGGTGGYILSGITVAPAGPEPSGAQEQQGSGSRGAGRGGRRGGKRGRR
jgi:tRNA (adenine-N(1)-)-methyltransferase non-catalytic subunit